MYYNSGRILLFYAPPVYGLNKKSLRGCNITAWSLSTSKGTQPSGSTPEKPNSKGGCFLLDCSKLYYIAYNNGEDNSDTHERRIKMKPSCKYLKASMRVQSAMIHTLAS